MTVQGKGHRPQRFRRHRPGHEATMQPRPDYAPRYPGSGRLQGKVAIVTGGDSGIGRAVSVLFAREGASVVIAHLEENRDAAETLSLVKAEGSDGLVLRGDVGDPRYSDRVVAATVDRFGQLDILVNNAAEQRLVDTLTEIPRQQIEQTFRTNIFAYMYMAQAALPHLRSGSAIINTASITAYRGSGRLIDYAATKGAVVAFTRSLASNLAAKGIRVNGVAPGPIWTPIVAATFPPDSHKTFGRKQPLGRPGQPAEVAPSFLFLACEDSSYMTGQMLHPNGGEIVGA